MQYYSTDGFSKFEVATSNLKYNKGIRDSLRIGNRRMIRFANRPFSRSFLPGTYSRLLVQDVGRARIFSVGHRAASTSQKQSKSGTNKPPRFKIWYPVIGGLTLATLGGIKYFHDHVGGTEGLARTISFYSLAIPKYVVYRYHSWRESPDHVWEELDRETSKEGLVKILELEGFYVKCM